MEKRSGNLFIRVPNEPMKKGEVVVGHQHNFDHTTFCVAGGLRIDLLDVHELNADGNPVEATIVASAELWAGENYSGQNWHLIEKGKFHQITALADGTVYQCVYSHRAPQAISMWPAGQRPSKPLTKRDEEGDLWMRVDETVTQESTHFGAAYV